MHAIAVSSRGLSAAKRRLPDPTPEARTVGAGMTSLPRPAESARHTAPRDNTRGAARKHCPAALGGAAHAASRRGI